MKKSAICLSILLNMAFSGEKRCHFTQALYVFDARLYNAWELSVSCNGWHSLKTKIVQVLNLSK